MLTSNLGPSWGCESWVIPKLPSTLSYIGRLQLWTLAGSFGIVKFHVQSRLQL